MKMVQPVDFPQADRLIQVGKVALAVAQGNHADKEIETFIGLDSGGRQGRYYRSAAVVLGLISNERNHANLTPLGEEFATLKNASARMDFLAQCLVESPVFHAALLYIHKHNPNDDQLKRWFRSFFPGAEATANRRFHTFVSYLRDAGLLQTSGSTNRLRKFVGNVVKKPNPPTKGLTGKKRKQLPPATGAKGVIRVDVDAQKRERANQIHWKLIDAKSTFLDDRQLEPLANEHIDLFANDQGDIILYEMKSVNAESGNLLAQVRKAVSQLYEYRFIYNEPAAKLCIVTNHKIAKEDDWLIDYLSKDRLIAYEWTTDFQNFECSARSRKILGDFVP
jgi:hypothetical protein